jgi:hypothetical protein
VTTADKLELGQGNPLFTTQFRALSEGVAGNGVLAAGELAVSADPNTALGLLVGPGSLRYGGSDYSLDAQASLSLTSGDATYDRWDTVVFDTASGGPAVREGVAEQYPTPPDLGVDDHLLAVVYVPSGASDVPDSNVLDWRAHHQGAAAVRVADAPGNYTSDNVEGALAEAADAAAAAEAAVDAEDAGQVATSDAAPIYTTGLADGETLSVRTASLTLADGQAAPTGVDLVIATLDNSGGGTVQATVLAGDGATVYAGETGSPIASYANDSGGAQTVGVLVDNGHFTGGSGGAGDHVQVFAATGGSAE